MIKKGLSYILVAIVLLSVFAMGVSVSAQDGVYLESATSTVDVGEMIDVDIRVNTTDFQGGQINLTYDPSVVNVTAFVNNSEDFEFRYWGSGTGGKEWILFAANYSPSIPLSGNYKVGTLTVEGISPGTAELGFGEDRKLFNDSGNETEVAWVGFSVDVSDTTTFELPLVEGWNLISIPLEISDTSLNTVFSDASDGDMVYAYDNGVWGISTYYSDYTTWDGDVTVIQPDKGYWYLATSEYTANIEGTEAGSRNVPIAEGWNLIGYTRLSEAGLNDLITESNGCSNSDMVYAYDNGVWGISTYYSDYTTWDGDVTVMEPGRGYWYLAIAPFTWEY
ncbi:MAG: hypothetical protein SYNGOMJ08_00284 [Candidatus Syntrophoarchaeum sp. GoM_oil]|nr:MAG: hypothetical protein SYNGOMJ08_00284 [Candidatus Syntrophoarchaeum sp. GoM_oil]